MWSKTSRARKPHLYFNYFQESLAALTDKLDIKTSTELIDIIEYKNNSLANWDFTDMNDTEVKVEFSFGYILDSSQALKIHLHHSSMPAKIQ